ncbi:FMN-binding negative transcriptional regulator [Planococcus salinus]|uniref:FMN-binding negative transcriptional regulator n=1 Tax=Planococcus salinus TaxID=1848460 RepID=A0A3M8PAE2_9BACL|nr:FMN-binding negative transcriptional regulator [Planococcus salinus]RNF40361.1 FMN-binding negative transcriptional regulator [Planococcus salinus]
MYIPKFYRVNNMEEVREFIEQNAFGTLITTQKGRPIATHLPMQLRRENDYYYLTGHFAYGNPQWRTLEESEEILVTFQGPHAYISSSWYEQENVPTWNYQAAHVYGMARLLSEDELKQDLTRLLETYEKHREQPVLWETMSSGLLEKELKGIVGFKLKITEIQAAYKLSQNRSDADYQNIIGQLRKEDYAGSKQIADVMQTRKPGDAT